MGRGVFPGSWIRWRRRVPSASLPARASSLVFPVSVAGSDPSLPGGESGSGIVSYDIYVSDNGGPFTLWRTVPATNPSDLFTAQSTHTYAFRSVAHDLAGNTEQKLNRRIDASVYAPDLSAPVTTVTSANATTDGTFTIAFTGTANGGSGLKTLNIFLQLDGGTATIIGQINGPTAVGGVYSGQIKYQAATDGQSHSYRFFAQGMNGDGIIELTHAAPNDVQVSATFQVPAAPVITGFSVQSGLVERSFIRTVDVAFNSLVANLPLDTTHVVLKHYGLDGTTFIENVNLTGKIHFVDHVMTIDFGALGLGGSPSTMAADGYYKLLIDPDGTGTHNARTRFLPLAG